MAGIAVTFVLLVIVGIQILRYHGVVGYPSTYTLAPYQAGIVYRRGKAVREAGPGRHLVFVGTEKIIFLDKRPIQVSFEDRAVALADGSVAIYGFALSAQVANVNKVMYASATYGQIPAFVALCVTRKVLNQYDTGRVLSSRSGIQEEIIRSCQSRLAASGFDLNSFRLTQLRIATPEPQ